MRHSVHFNTSGMLQALINNVEIPAHSLQYDEWVYRKYNPDLEVCTFQLIIDYDEFERRLRPRYLALIEEMVADDLATNENFFLDAYQHASYPLFEEVITNADNNYLMDFLNHFFIRDMLLEYTGREKAPHGRPEWVIREVMRVRNDKKNVYINGNVQPVIHL
jgi:hypothetical protein